jgi:hypothetical protein
MTDESPRRYKTPDELTTDEIAQRLQARNRNEAEPKFETAEYQEARAEALRDAGFEGEAAEYEAATGGRSLEEMTPADHFQRIQKGNR